MHLNHATRCAFRTADRSALFSAVTLVYDGLPRPQPPVLARGNRVRGASWDQSHSDSTHIALE